MEKKRETGRHDQERKTKLNRQPATTSEVVGSSNTADDAIIRRISIPGIIRPEQTKGNLLMDGRVFFRSMLLRKWTLVR